MKGRYSLLIFDWDGTLADSAARILNSFRNAAEMTGVAPPDPEKARFCIGLGLQETFTRLYPGMDADRISGLIAQYRDCYFREPTPVDPFPGVVDGLAALQQQGYQLAVATGKSHEGLMHGLRDFGLCDRFACTRCADQSRPKPDPLMLFEILESTGKEAGEALMIGDTTHDLQMAARAGMDGWGVGYGSHSPDRLHPLSCMDVARDFAEVVGRLSADS